MSLHKYLKSFRQGMEKLARYGYAESIEIGEEIRAGEQAIIKAKVILIDGSILHIKEYIDAKYRVEKLSYGYQYQDRYGELLFRYDNAVHKPPLRFREHKHTRNGAIIEASAPSISDLIDEVIECL